MEQRHRTSTFGRVYCRSLRVKRILERDIWVPEIGTIQEARRHALDDHLAPQWQKLCGRPTPAKTG